MALNLSVIINYMQYTKISFKKQEYFKPSTKRAAVKRVVTWILYIIYIINILFNPRNSK
jgi:hypothetical protein